MSRVRFLQSFFKKNVVSVDSLSKALDYFFPLVVRLKPLFRKILWPQDCVGGWLELVQRCSGIVGFGPRGWNFFRT